MSHEKETPVEFWRGLLLAFGLAGIVYLLGCLVAVAVLF